MSVYPELFKRIYADKVGGYGSGGGSCEENCWPYLRLIERIIAQYQPDTVLDIGCGDGQVASRIDWGGARYIGMDVTQEPLTMHTQRRASTLILADALEDDLPYADLVLTKEATQHMDLASIHQLLGRLRRYSRIVHTSVIDSTTNCEIQPGMCRTVDLSKYPFEAIGGTVQTVLMWRCGQALPFMTQIWEPK